MPQASTKRKAVKIWIPWTTLTTKVFVMWCCEPVHLLQLVALCMCLYVKFNGILCWAYSSTHSKSVTLQLLYSFLSRRASAFGSVAPQVSAMQVYVQHLWWWFHGATFPLAFWAGQALWSNCVVTQTWLLDVAWNCWVSIILSPCH